MPFLISDTKDALIDEGGLIWYRKANSFDSGFISGSFDNAINIFLWSVEAVRQDNS
jgi:hypothetical protein